MGDLWNPIDAVKAKYPNMGLSDQQIYQNLQDPAKFRSAFPEYSVTDDEIRTNIQKFGLSRPDLQAPPPAAGGNLQMEQSSLGLGGAAAMRPASRGTQAEAENFHPVVAGAAKGAMQTVYPAVRAGANAAAEIAGQGDVLPQQRPEELQAHGFSETVGHAGEGIGEYMLGEAAVSATAKALLEAGKVATAAEYLKKAAQLKKQYDEFKEAHTAARVIGGMGEAGAQAGLVGGGQALAHGESLGEAAKTGLVTGAVGGATEGVSSALEALRPAKIPILPPEGARPGVDLPVRASVAEPGVVNKIAEFAADKPALQRFDIEQTQATAREAIAELATRAKNESVHDIAGQRIAGFMNELTARLKATGLNFGDLPAEEQKAFYAANKSILDEADAFLKTNSGDFRDYANTMRQQLQTFYKRATVADPAFQVAQDAAAKARAGFDNAEVAKQEEIKKALFDKANGSGMYEKVTGLYNRVDALAKIGAKLDALSVYKNTPSDFLKSLPKNTVDPGVIDGAALKRAVRELARETETKGGQILSVWDRAGITPDTVLKLQQLGDILERSKVGTKSVFRGPVGAGAAGGVTAEGLGLVLSHALSSGTVAAGMAGAALTNKFLGHLMTNPAALDYTLRAARVLFPAAANATQIESQHEQPQPTPQSHVFSPAEWKKANPGGDVNEAMAEAKRQGYELA